MASRDEYAELVKKILRDYASIPPSVGEVEVEVIFAEAQGHFELIYTGWQGWKRIHGVVIHIDIRDGKIWIQHDGTESGVAEELLAAGVPHSDIVLGFHAPRERALTPFAVG